MGGDRDSGMYDAYHDLVKTVQEIIENVESGDLNFEGAIDQLKEALPYY